LFSVWLLLAHGFNLIRSPRDEFYLAIVVVLSTLASFIIAFIAGGVIADTNRRFKTAQAFIVGTAIVGLWWLFGYLTGHDYAADPTWLRYSGYVNDIGTVLAPVVGRYLLADFGCGTNQRRNRTNVAGERGIAPFSTSFIPRGLNAARPRRVNSNVRRFPSVRKGDSF